MMIQELVASMVRGDWSLHPTRRDLYGYLSVIILIKVQMQPVGRSARQCEVGLGFSGSHGAGRGEVLG